VLISIFTKLQKTYWDPNYISPRQLDAGVGSD